MSEIEAFIARTQRYCAATGASETTVSRKLLGNGARLAALKAGNSLRVDTFERAKRILSEMEQDARAA